MNRVLMTTAFVLLASGCSTASGLPTLPDREATLAGSVVAVNIDTPTSNGRPTIHVKADSEDECGIVFALDADTDILRRGPATGALIRGHRQDLVAGTRVRVWARGAIADSCPGQAVAATVEVVRL